MHDPVDLFDDVNGGHQDKIQVDPVILEDGRYRSLAEQAGNKQVGVNDSLEFMRQWYLRSFLLILPPAPLHPQDCRYHPQNNLLHFP